MAGAAVSPERSSLPRRFASLVKIEHTVFALPFAYVGLVADEVALASGVGGGGHAFGTASSQTCASLLDSVTAGALKAPRGHVGAPPA